MKIRNTSVLVLVSALVIGLSACSTAVVPEPDHKAKTTACLIRSTVIVPGTPEKQLAADLVEAKIVYGVAVREIKIDPIKEQVQARLLQALQAGCVVMVSSNANYVDDLAKFALDHPRMIILFVGGNIAAENQPANFRWVADDLQSSVRMAGFFAAGKSTNSLVHLFIQPVYFESKEIRKSFVAGVKDFDLASGTESNTVFIRTPNSKTLSENLMGLGSSDVAAIFGGKSIWQNVEPESVDGPYLIGSDLQLGETTEVYESRVQASVERTTSKYVFETVSALLDRKFNSTPLYRKPGALKFNTVELRLTQRDSVAGDLLEALDSYRQDLISR